MLCLLNIYNVNNKSKNLPSKQKQINLKKPTFDKVGSIFSLLSFLSVKESMMNTTLTHSSITVLGAGSFGTALAIAFSRNGHLTRLWGHNPTKMQKLDSERQNTEFLPEIVFPDSLQIETDLA